MLTVFPCHASQDAAVARELTEFLQAGAGVRVFLDEGRIQPGQHLLSKVSEGLTSEVVLLLLSPDSAPARRVREEWQPILEDAPDQAGVMVAPVLLRDCGFYPKLRKGKQFDLRTDRLAGFREIKRWLLQLQAEEQDLAPGRPARFLVDRAALECLGRTIADARGSAVLCGPESSGKTSLALAFVHEYLPDYEKILWVYAGARTPAAVFGELAQQFDLRPEGDAIACRDAVQARCADRRQLVVLDDLRNPDLIPAITGASSVLITTRDPAVAARAGGAVTPYTAFSPDLDAARHAIEGLAEFQRILLAAYCACSPGGSPLPFAAQIGGLEEKASAEAANTLWSAGLLTQLDRITASYAVPSHILRLMAAEEDIDVWRERHAQCAGRTKALLVELEHALCWAAENPELRWPLACEIARRGIFLSREKGRLAEALAFIEQLLPIATVRKDRRMLEFLTWEKIWLLKAWGRFAEAARLDLIRRDQYVDQMSFGFVLGA